MITNDANIYNIAQTIYTLKISYLHLRFDHTNTSTTFVSYFNFLECSVVLFADNCRAPGAWIIIYITLARCSLLEYIMYCKSQYKCFIIKLSSLGVSGLNLSPSTD